MFFLRKLFKILLLPILCLILLLKALLVAFKNLSSTIIGFMVLLIGFGIVYCIYSHRYQEIIIFLVVGMIMMAGMLVVTFLEGICDTVSEMIIDL